MLNVNGASMAASLETTIDQGEPTQLNARAKDADEEPLTFSMVTAAYQEAITSFDPTSGALECFAQPFTLART